MPQRLAKLARLNRILHAISPDVVISEAPLDPIGFGRFKVVHVIHDTKFAGKHGRRWSNVARHLHGISVRKADAVMTVSHAEAANIRALYGAATPIIVSYNGLDTAWIDTLAPSGTWEHDILYVSNFAAHKGHQDLIRTRCRRSTALPDYAGGLQTSATKQQ